MVVPQHNENTTLTFSCAKENTTPSNQKWTTDLLPRSLGFNQDGHSHVVLGFCPFYFHSPELAPRHDSPHQHQVARYLLPFLPSFEDSSEQCRVRSEGAGCGFSAMTKPLARITCQAFLSSVTEMFW